MKRKISLVLALIMVLTIIPSNIFAEVSHDKQLKEAIIKSKELFNIGSEYDKFNQSISSRDGETVFYLNWSDSKEKLGNINVSITAEGLILNYGKWEPTYGEQATKLPSISKEEGLEIAEAFIKKVSPNLAGNIRYIDTLEPLNIYSNSYNYHFVRIENGIPYYNNNIEIQLDNSTGEINNYYNNWDMDLEFIDTKDIISLEKAEELYKEKIGLDLIYKLGYRDMGQNVFLIYGPLNRDLGINAKDGEIAPVYGDYGLYNKFSQDLGGRGSFDLESAELSPDEEKAIDDISGLISKEEAEKIARETLELDEEYNLNNINLYTSWRNDDEYTWDMYFLKNANDKAYFTDVSINAKTKKLIRFYRSSPIDSDEKAQYNREESLNIAKEFIKKFNSENYSEIELREDLANMNSFEEQKRYSFQFVRKIDNAYVENDGVAIYIDAVNGKVEQYGLTWTNKDFPSNGDVIELDKAYDVLFNDIEIELKYTTGYGYDIYGRDPTEKKEAVLVYGLKSDKPANIDANTGNILSDGGEVYKEPRIIRYKDIEGSYARDKINILAQYGITLAGEEFKPKEKIIQKDFLYLLAKAKYPYYGIGDSEDNLYKQLINMGVIKENEKSPEKIVTKEEAVKYIIRALQYDKIADLTEIYKDIFNDTKDITPELKGYISIAYGLGIVQGYNGNLNPKAELKRQDAANMIYNLLFSDN